MSAVEKERERVRSRPGRGGPSGTLRAGASPTPAVLGETITGWTGRDVGPEDGASVAGEDQVCAPPRSDVSAGSTIGRHRVLRHLASGGMGVIYHAEDLELGGEVAIKVPHERLLENRGAMLRFLAEGSAAARVAHPGVVRVLDRGWFSGGPYLAMEYLPGENLRGLLERRPRLPISRVLDIGTQIGRALAAVHEAGVVHCDVKPANIHLVREACPAGRRVVKVIDFGVARVSGEARPLIARPGDLIGTPCYMAPEQGVDACAADRRSDIYSLGCVLYQLATGCVPFRGSTLQTLIAHRTEAPAPPASLRGDLPRGLDALILNMMAKSPDRRPCTVMDVVGALGRIEPDRSARAA
ncbi:MAG TPA: serine/threonine-protein kinase [Kofleriaceae bacterium]|nr:serine/threonine-protein kinase [Kofleriaceae bacterium]